MRTRLPRIANFDDLMASRYGKPDKRLLRSAASADALLEDYYGKLPARGTTKARPTVALSILCDDGKQILAQRNRFANGYNGRVRLRKATQQAATDGPGGQPNGAGSNGAPLLGTVENAPAAPPPAAAYASEPTLASAETPNVGQPHVSATPISSERTPVPPTQVGPSPTPASPISAAASRLSSADDQAAPSPSEDDFLADMQSIFAGQSVYDKKTVRREKLKEHAREPDPHDQDPDGPPPMEPNESQRIFDRIAQSMQYAGAYDLGTVDLENRFADFDRLDEAQKKTAAAKRSRPKSQQPDVPRDLKPGSAEFLEDLDAINKQTENTINAVQPVTTREASLPKGYSGPLYDTGEHVLAGGDLYQDELLIGKPPGVACSYGHIIAMADLFSSVDQMMAEDAAVLRNIKQLIDQSTAYYKGNKVPSLKDVSTEDWQKATGDRYLKLAEDNYDHFAPNLFYKNESFARNANRYVNNKSAWEQHHERAIKAAQEMALDPANANRSYVPIWPLTINAFGDHFLTDAFAAGHVINKGVVAEYFKSMFYTGKGLNDKGRLFFERLASKAWTGRVAEEFKKLETYDDYGGIFTLYWHPDIKNAERFGEVLKGAAEQEPDKIANIAVKAIHDVLNRNGIDVVNDKGNGPWKLTGDGYLTQTTLAIMKQAVQASAENITDSGILASNIAIGNFFAKVWAYVPKLTQASEAKLKSLVSAYVTPDSAPLLDAATKIIHNEVDALIKLLIEKKALQRI
jgi:hypothetical protein